MTIVEQPTADGSVPLTQAHIDKIDELVNENSESVGYSIGGDSAGKEPTDKFNFHF